MEPWQAITVAIISAAASVVAAVFAFIAATRSARAKADADLAIERVRAEDARRWNAFEIAARESEPLAAALSQAWSDVQQVRDVIAMATAPAQYDQETALTTVRHSTESLTVAYQRFGGTLPAEADGILHLVKHSVTLVEPLLLDRGTGPRPRPGASPDVDARLLRVRSSLREHQASLQQASIKLRTDLMTRILADLARG